MHSVSVMIKTILIILSWYKKIQHDFIKIKPYKSDYKEKIALTDIIYL